MNEFKQRTLDLGSGNIELRAMTSADGEPMISFAKDLPAHDLLFLKRDITNEKVIAAWIRDLQAGSIETILAVEGETIVGCAAVITDPLSWSQHVGELRVLVSSSMRQKGLGRVMIEEMFKIAIERDLTKLTAQMTIDQKGAIAIFEELGFRGEALLKEHVIGSDGKSHDIVILSCDPARAASVRTAYDDGN